MLDRNAIKDITEARSISEFHKALKRNDIVSSNPRFITAVLDISNKCNLRCRMCYFSHDKYFKAPAVYMTPETFESIAKDLLPHAATLTLSCGSEPLMSPHFIEILKRASKYKVPHVDFATNGVLLNEEIAEAVIKYGVTDLMLSIESPEKETFEYIRRGASFDRFIGNIKHLVKRKKELKSYTPVLRFNITLMRSNIEQVEKLVELAAELEVSLLDFRHLVIYDGLGMEKESLSHYKDLSNYWLKKARAKAEELGLTIVTFPKEFGKKEPEQEASQPQEERKPLKYYLNILKRNPQYFLKSVYSRLKPQIKKDRKTQDKSERQELPDNFVYCKLPFNYTLINSGGNVLPCPHCHGVSEFGTITPDNSFEDVWFNEKFRQLRRNILNQNPPEMCRVCSILSMYNLDENSLSISRSV